MEDRRSGKIKSIGLMIFSVAFGICVLIFCFLRFSVIAGFVKKVCSVLTPIFIGIVLCYLTSPLYNAVSRWAEKKLPGERPGNHRAAKVLATISSFLAIVIVIYGLLALIIPQVLESLANLYNQLPDYFARTESWFRSMVTRDFQMKGIVLSLAESVGQYLESFLSNTIVPNIDKIVTSLFTSVKGVVRAFYNVIIGIIAALYLLNFKDTLLPQCRKLIYAILGHSLADGFCRELSFIDELFGGFITGKLLDSLLIGLLCFIGCTVMSMPYTILVSVIVGVTNIIPFFGPFIGAIPTTFIILMADPRKALWFVIFILCLQQLDGNYIGPKILGNTTGISSFWILFSILLFGGLLGFAGMILAVPTWALLLSAVKRIAEKQLIRKKLPVPSSAYKPGVKVEPEKEEEK